MTIINPNILAYCALFGWPIVIFILFHKLPRSSAIIWSILAGYLFLPTGLSIDLPLLPPISKTLVPSVFTVIAVFLFRKFENNVPRKKSSKLLIILLCLFLVTPVITVLENTEPILLPNLYIPGLRIYDIFGMIILLLITIIPFLLARRYLASAEDHLLLLRSFVIGGLIYSLLILIEVRLSPQLNVWVYGYFPHSFAQHIRGSGYRPIVFLQHGLWVGIFISMAVLAAATIWRNFRKQHINPRLLFIILWLFSVLFLSKTLGAFSLTVIFLPIILLSTLRTQRLISAVVAICVLFYPILRSANLAPVETVYQLALHVNEDRGSSFKTRIDNENTLLEKAKEKPLAGWGLWGRGLIYDTETGRNLSITDGAWIIAISSFGWLGYISQFGLLCLPIFVLALRLKKDVTVATSGLCVILTVNLIDLIPNATLTPLTFMIAGALMGYSEQNNSPQIRSSKSAFVSQKVKRKKRE